MTQRSNQLPSLAVILHREGLIGKDIADSASFDAIMAEVKEAICKDYRNMSIFGTILCNLSSTVSIGTSIIREYKSKYMTTYIVKNK